MNSEFYRRLESFCTEKFGTYRQAALAVDLSESYFTSLKSRNRLPSFNALQRLQPHGLDLFWLFTGEPYSENSRQEGLDIEARRALLLQQRYAQNTGRGAHGESAQRSTSMGESLDALSIAELWDQLSTQFPGTPLWEQLSPDLKRKHLYAIAREVLSMQEQSGQINEEES